MNNTTNEKIIVLCEKAEEEHNRLWQNLYATINPNNQQGGHLTAFRIEKAFYHAMEIKGYLNLIKQELNR